MDADRPDHPTGPAGVLSRRLFVGSATALALWPQAALAATPERTYHRRWRAWTEKLVLYRNFSTVMLVNFGKSA